MVSCRMPPGSSGKAINRGRKDKESIAPLLQNCRDLADPNAHIAAASGAADFAHIEASKHSGNWKAQAYQKLRARLVYALSDAEDHGAIRMPPLVPQPMDGQSSAAEPSHSTAQDVICNAESNADSAAAMGSSAASQAEINDATGASAGSSHDDISRHGGRLEVSVGAFSGRIAS